MIHPAQQLEVRAVGRRDEKVLPVRGRICIESFH